MMSRTRSVAGLAALVGVSLTVSGCALVSRPLAWLSQPRQVKVQPVETAFAPGGSTVDRLYAGAARDLRDRNYGQALARLHMAREMAPADVRVLNALGVAYDKVGRFDLSRRYYDQALAAEPGAREVLANLDYSARLQGMASAAQAPQAPVSASAVRGAGFQLARGSTTLMRTAPIFVGEPVVIVDASGSSQTARQVRAELMSRGWAVATTVVAADVPRAGGQIVFPHQHADAARALARTLPFPVELSACAESCVGLRLTLGTNSRWSS